MKFTIFQFRGSLKKHDMIIDFMYVKNIIFLNNYKSIYYSVIQNFKTVICKNNPTLKKITVRHIKVYIDLQNILIYSNSVIKHIHLKGPREY